MPNTFFFENLGQMRSSLVPDSKQTVETSIRTGGENGHTSLAETNVHARLNFQGEDQFYANRFIDILRT